MRILPQVLTEDDWLHHFRADVLSPGSQLGVEFPRQFGAASCEIRSVAQVFIQLGELQCCRIEANRFAFVNVIRSAQFRISANSKSHLVRPIQRSVN